MSSKAAQYRAIDRACRVSRAIMIIWCGVRLGIRVIRHTENVADAYIIYPNDPEKHDGAVNEV